MYGINLLVVFIARVEPIGALPRPILPLWGVTILNFILYTTIRYPSPAVADLEL
ncbi:hypothetical protein JW998_15290 [candidate division KSB1 bacterium]|nr:hypothetical protein [candidate division KSB1 bacterium]